MGQRIPTRGQPSNDEVEAYITDMISMMSRLADDADLPDLGRSLRQVLARVLPSSDPRYGPPTRPRRPGEDRAHS